MNKDKLEAFLEDYKKLIEKHGLCIEGNLYYGDATTRAAKMLCSIEEEIDFIRKNTLES